MSEKLEETPKDYTQISEELDKRLKKWLEEGQKPKETLRVRLIRKKPKA